MILSSLKRKLESFDWILFILTSLLIILGLVIQYSLSLGLEPTTFHLFERQLSFVLLGLILFFLFSFLDFRIFKFLAPFLYLLCILLLVLVLIFGQPLRGVRGWFFLGLFYFQPVELAKIVLIILLAKIWAGKVKEMGELKKIFSSVLFLLPLVFLTFLQPDLGSALVFILIWFFITCLNVQRIKYIVFIILIFILISFILWQFVLEDYQKERIITFFSPHQDPLGRGYQISQAKIAIGAGKLFGRGIGEGSQGQMRFLPASRTDFIFATLAEELGFLGSTLVIGLFTLIFLKIIRISRMVYDNFSFFLILGIGFNLFLQVIINIGMNLGLLPIIGLPLPLLSYGGSSLIATLVSLGIVESAIIHQKLSFT